MDTMISAYVGGKVRYLHYSVEVMFAVNEKYSSVQQMLDGNQKYFNSACR